MEQQITALARQVGVDLVGFTDRARLADAPPSSDLRFTLPNAESAISLVVALDRGAVRKYITNAKLEPSPLVEEDWCTECNFCVATCPTQ